MDEQHRELVIHSFYGGRFADNGIGLDVLSELTTYRQILIETAKELWRQRNPDRQRLPRNFDENIILKFYEIRPGSVQIPIVRDFPPGAQLALVDELDEAVELVSEAVAAVDANKPLPYRFPKNVLPLFENYGCTLREDEHFELNIPSKKTRVSYNSETRNRLVRWTESQYEDSIDIVGRVLMARVNRPRMAIELDDGREVESVFPVEEEKKILEALSEHAHAKVRVLGRGLFDPSGTLLKITSIERIDLLSTGAIEYVETAKPIWEEFDEIVSSIPENDLKKLPKDAAEHHDRFLYGGPKEDK